MQSVPITTVSSNSAQAIQHYMIKFVSDLQQVCGFMGTPVFFTNKTDCHDIPEILLKVALITINYHYLQYISVDLNSILIDLWSFQGCNNYMKLNTYILNN
jgi:predicted nucleic acid-binding Zn finger protein